MKITLDIPDDTTGAFFIFLHGSMYDLNLKSHAISYNDMHDGAVIVIDEKGKTEDRK